MRWTTATKTSKFGRASGGCLFGYKKSLASCINVRFEECGTCNVVQLSVNGENTLIVPVYINRKKWQEDFGKIQKIFQEEAPIRYILLGDFNVRIGNLQELPEEMEVGNLGIAQSRVSKDKVVDACGKKLVEWIDDFGGIILNGRKCGDEEGEFTYVDSMGKSVNDLGIVSFSLLPLINNFRVLNETYSDHFPITLNLSYNKVHKIVMSRNLLPKIMWRNSVGNNYKTDLERQIGIEQLPADNDAAVIRLTEIIKDTAQKYTTSRKVLNKKHEWYDWECDNLRNKCFKWLRVFRRTNANLAKMNYLRLNRELKSLCRAKKAKYNWSIAQELNTVHDAKQWWKLVKKFGRSNYSEEAGVDVDDLKIHFEVILNPENIIREIVYAAPFIQNDFMDAEFSLGEMLLVLGKMKDNKAPGVDRIPVEFYKNAPTEFLVKMLDIFNDIYRGGKMPVCFKRSLIFPLHKKGVRTEASNYRGISFIDSFVKVYTNILLSRLNSWVESNHILHENQAGFRKGYSTVDNLFILHNIIALKMNKKEKLYTFFVDFKTAFDGVTRGKLFYKLLNAGLSTKFVNNIEEMYNGTESAVWSGNKCSGWFNTNVGVRQGCAFSPLFFAIYVNDLVDFIKGGVRIAGVTINVLLYADDIILLANSSEEMQVMINSLEEYCSMWDLIINLQKSKIMIFGGGRRAAREKWYLGDQEIEIVSEYKYLGMILTPKLSMQKHLNERLKVAKYSINSMWSNVIKNEDISISTKYKVFEACSRSVLCYGAQVWGFREFDTVEKGLTHFLKRLVGLPDNTPNYMLLLETDSKKVFLYTMKLHINFVLKCLNLPDGRFPKIVAREIINANIYWYAEWSNWAESLDVPLDIDNTVSIRGQVNDLLENLHLKNLQVMVEAARQGVHHDLYNQLNYGGLGSYFADGMDIRTIRVIFRARGGLLQLNTRSWGRAERMVCSLCNLNEPEDMFHFLGICPILKQFRLRFFGSRVLGRKSVIDILNGRNWTALYEYIKVAYKYRQALVDEFNY